MINILHRYSSIKQRGFIVPTLLALTTIIGILLLTITQTTIDNYSYSVRENSRKNAQFSADAGLDVGLGELNKDETYTGTVGEVELLNDGKTRTTYEITVTVTGSVGENRLIRSEGRTYNASTGEQLANRIYQIEALPIVASSASIVTGVGGLIMENSSKIVDGSVFVNGEIFMDGTAQIGTSTNPLQIFVANRVCPIPADSTFPRDCGPGENTNPIFIGSPNSFIYGEVWANYQADDTNMINVDDPGNSSLQLDPVTPSPPVSEQPLPNHPRQTQIDNVIQTIDASAASCTTTSGTRVWGPNMKITGNVEVSRKCTVTILGDVWITGSLKMYNQGSIEVSDSLDPVVSSTGVPTVMVDGADGFEMNQSSLLVKNSSNKNVQIITYWSTASCSPDCTDVTGPELLASQTVPTIDIVNSGGAEEAIFYARWSEVVIRNAVNVGALVGQQVHLENSAVIAFGSDLAGFTPQQIWVKRGYLRVFN